MRALWCLIVLSACEREGFTVKPLVDGGDTADAIIPTEAPVIVTTTLPPGEVGLAYIAQLTGVSLLPITWSISSGTLPPGLSLDAATGDITGTPSSAGTFALTVTADTGTPPMASADLSLVIDPMLQSVEGYTIPNPSKIAKQFVTPHAGANGAGPDINAWAVDPTRCANDVPGITALWHHNIDFDDHAQKVTTDFPAFAPNHALSYQFVPTTAAGGGTIFITMGNGSNGGGAPAPTFVSLSTKPCDFDASQVNVSPCYASQPVENGISWVVTTGATPLCKLVPGQRYYLNLRFWDYRNPTLDACQTAIDYQNNGTTVCQALLQIRKNY